MGSDFQYSDAKKWYDNLDKLIKYVNLKSNQNKVNLFYSTPACYLYALNNANETWRVEKDDFFPYAMESGKYWTGYFTSRPALKYLVRKASNYLQAFRKLNTLSINHIETNPVDYLEKAMGQLQHHDGVSGTSQQHVTNDYIKQISFGIENALSQIAGNFEICTSLNISSCKPIEEKKSFSVLIFNPLACSVKYWFRFPVTHTDYEVFDENKTKLSSEIISVEKEVELIPERNSNANINILFAANLPPFGLKWLYFKRNKLEIKKLAIGVKTSNPFEIENEYIKYSFDSSGNMKKLYNKESNVEIELEQNYCIYKSGNSGAYLFAPQKLSKCETLNVISYTLYRGNEFNEVSQVYNDWISQTIRLYSDLRYAEFEWQIGPIDVDDNIGKEVVIRFNSNIKSNSTFYTDSNGREMLKRVRNFRSTWNLVPTEEISQNYYPINSRIFIRDEKTKKQLTIVNDRSQGGSSIKDGSIEIMLHRRILRDDGLGVIEPLNELGKDGKGLIVRGKMYLVLERIENSARIHRPLALQVNNEPVCFFNKYSEKKHGFEIVKNFSMPPNLHLLTLMHDYDFSNSKSLIVRIEHFYELNEDSFLSKPVTFDLRSIFKKIASVEELALGTNMNIVDLKERLQWKSNDNLQKKFDSAEENSSKYSFLFQPMQIRTFRIEL